MKIVRNVIPGILVILLMTCALHAQGQRTVQLKTSGAAYTVRTFYISNVTDERNGKDNAGSVSSNGKSEKLLMQNGAAKALEQYIATSVKQDRSQTAIELRIKKLDCDIKKKNSYWHINCSINFAFYFDNKLLVEYDGGGHGDMNSDPAEYAGDFIRQTLDGDLKKFDIWWAHNKDNVPTSSAVTVNFVIAKTIDDPDLIVYSSQRPLRIGDFQGAVKNSRTELAETASGNKYAYSVITEDGHLAVTYTITPYFRKPDSWFRLNDENARVLAHEQLHFDITALRTCEFITRMRTVTFTKDNYRKILDGIPDMLSKETNDMQQEYDTEGNHGIITDKQLMWEAKVKALLKQAGCY